MDRLTSMEVFVRVVDLGSFIAAAQALGLSRPMASKHVQRLEDRLGVRLLHRTTRRVSPTEAGRAFYLRCQEIFSQIDEATREAGDLQTTPKGRLRVNAPVGFGRLHLAAAIAAYQRSYPGVTVDLALNDRLVNLVEEGYDVAIRIGTLRDSSLIARRLAPGRLAVCGAPAYFARHPRPGRPADLAAHNCLRYTYAANHDEWSFSQGGTSQTVKVAGSLDSTSGEALVAAALEGLGLVLQPTFLVAPYLASGQLERVLPEFDLPAMGIHAIHPQGRLVPPKVRTFIDFLAARFGPEPYWDRDSPR